MKTTTNLGLKKIELTDSPPDITVQDFNWDSIDKHLNTAVKFSKATGTGTAITLTEVTLEDGFQKTFIVKANNSGVATKINGKNLYRPGSTLAPTLIAGRAVTVWYDLAGDCFFYKASAEGTALNLHVLAGLTFSNRYDTNIAGALAPRMPNLVRDSNYVAGVGLYENWQTRYVTSASKGGDITFTANGYGGGVFQQYTLDLSHKYFFSVSVSSPSQPESVYAQLNVMSGALNGKNEQAYNYSGGTQLLQGVFSPNGNYTGEVSFMVYDARMSNYSAISFRNPMLIDLTESFGAGKELDLYDMINILAAAGGWWNNNLKQLTSQVNATSSDMVAGKTAVVNGLKVTGTTLLNPRNIAGTVHSESLEPVVGAHSGDGKHRLYLRASTQRYAMETDTWITRAEPDLFPQNIVNGKDICGIAGTAIVGKRSASGTVTSAAGNISVTPVNNQSGYTAAYVTVSGLTFKPSYIILTHDNANYTSISVYSHTMDYYNLPIVRIVMISLQAPQNALPMAYQANNATTFVNSGGFQLPVTYSSTQYKWVAYE